MKKKINQLVDFLQTKNGLWIVLLGIVAANTVGYQLTNIIDFPGWQCRVDASGFSYHRAKQFTYFHYYTGDFPLATLNEDLTYTKEAALKEIEENGEDLIMEYQHWARLGENARIWAFMPNALLAGSPENPNIKLFNVLAFVAGLLLLYFGFWRSQKVLYGLIMVLMINLTPFYIFEVFARQNIFGLLGSVFFMVLGLNIYAIFKKESLKYLLVSAVVSGAIIGFFSEFRNEVSMVIGALILMMALVKNQHVLSRVVLVLLCFLSFSGSKKLIKSHFAREFDRTAELVEKAGGHVYNGKKIGGHRFWHPIFCGLGDFDEKYGFEWSDKAAYRYAMPILNDKYGMDLKYSDKYHLDNYYDADSIYYVKFDDIEEYEQIMKEKVMFHVKDDPGWYITIIAKRIVRTLTRTIPLPYIGWLIFPVAFILIRKKYWEYLKLIIIALPLSATSIIIIAGGGNTYNSVFVYFVLLAILMLWRNSRVNSVIR